MQTFREVSRSENEVTYEYRTALGYWMYGSVMAYISALAFDAPRAIELGAVGLVFAYFVVVYLPSRNTTKRLRRAMSQSSLKMEGNRWSFSNPLRITAPLEFADSSSASDSEKRDPVDEDA